MKILIEIPEEIAIVIIAVCFVLGGSAMIINYVKNINK